ncbi:hypothetical protein AB6A40_007886 [Gnathostoma spinigerum]|uniref:Uncharacterized protein n=1 Tax=Gnathostoma spinigerum TaxID=75299 RepID=A0ABD6EPS3_9BILA
MTDPNLDDSAREDPLQNTDQKRVFRGYSDKWADNSLKSGGRMYNPEFARTSLQDVLVRGIDRYASAEQNRHLIIPMVQDRVSQRGVINRDQLAMKYNSWNSPNIFVAPYNQLSR